MKKNLHKFKFVKAIRKDIPGIPDIEWYVDDMVPSDKVFMWDPGDLYIEDGIVKFGNRKREKNEKEI